jgi:hypothetical protein
MKKEKDESELTPKEALELLQTHLEGKKKRLHTFEGGAFLMGCDMDLSTIKERLNNSKHICLSGKNMKAMGHGVAYKQESGSYLFLETDKKKLEAIHKARKIKD